MAGLAGHLRWLALLRKVSQHGAAFAARAVDRPCCVQLMGELGNGPFEPMAPVIGSVRQEGESFEIRVERLKPRYPALAYLCEELVGQVRRHGVPEWLPNEIAVQRYHPGSLGITPHRDPRRFALLVAVITVAGSAPFTLCSNRAGDPIRTWQVSEGSLVLLRGHRLAGEVDDRPMHVVGGPTGCIPRTSIGIRMQVP
jgi:hypothetical protein